MALLLLWIVFIFLLGASIGSFLNVVVGRLPYEKSLLWPASTCPRCWQPIAWYDNLPILSWLLLRGRCRRCGLAIAVRYLLVELGTGLAFVGLFYAEMIANVVELPILTHHWGVPLGFFPPGALALFFHHAILMSFLLAASLCDLNEMEIPLSITLWGTLIGLILSTVFPWPFPETLALVAPVEPGMPVFPPTRGVYAWPVWYPLPDWLPQGSWQEGLATGLAGALAGMALLRGVRFLFSLGRGIEGLGVGDADLMMMAGAFIGWQPVLVAFLVAVGPGLVFALGQLFLRGQQSLPFGPSLSMGVMITVLCWPALGVALGPAMFDAIIVGSVALGGAIALLFVSFLLRLIG
ncbi:MAG: prepilin peptidase [Gemmataceae bacterium]